MSSPIKTLFTLLSLIIFMGGCSYRGYTPPNTSISEPAPSSPRSSKAIHRATLRAYTVHGKTYHPTIVSIGWEQDGIASWYGPNFHGGATSNGERYNMYAMTAAHKTLPMNTMVRVTNKRNGRSVVVRINDRGPFVRGRIIDLSYMAAKKLGIDKMGTAPVRVEVLGFDSLIASLAKNRARGAVSAPVVRQQVILEGFGVQVGAFRRLHGAQIYRQRYDNFEGRYHAQIKKFIVDGEPLYRVWLMGFQSEDEAKDFIKSWGIPGAFIIRG